METQRQYEVVFIVDPTADDDEVTRLTDNLKQIVTDQGGTITKTESMGKRKLAYEILHKTEGSFGSRRMGRHNSRAIDTEPYHQPLVQMSADQYLVE